MLKFGVQVWPAVRLLLKPRAIDQASRPGYQQHVITDKGFPCRSICFFVP